jgi:hypothetical protein
VARECTPRTGELDAAVAAAYGWNSNISEEDAVRELLDLNLARSGAPTIPSGTAYVVGPSEFERISEVEGIQTSNSMRDALDEFEGSDWSDDERRRMALERLKQVTR